MVKLFIITEQEVANITERKNPHNPVNGVKEFVCLLPNFTPIISELAKQNRLKFFLGHLWQKDMSEKWPAGLGPRVKTATFCQNIEQDRQPNRAKS